MENLDLGWKMMSVLGVVVVVVVVWPDEGPVPRGGEYHEAFFF